MATIDIKELRKEVEEDRKALAEKEAVLSFLEKREGKSVSSTSNTELDGIIQLNELVPNEDRRSLTTDVRDAVLRFGKQEFSVAHVDAVLKQNGIIIKGKFPRSRITTVLGKLEDQGLIINTFKGSGSVPNRYKLKEENDDDL